MIFFFFGGGGHNCKANTHIFFHVYVNFLPVLHIVNSLKITKTLIYSVLTKMIEVLKSKLDARPAQRQNGRFI